MGDRESSRRQPANTRVLVLAFIAVIGSFFASTLIVQRSSTAIATLSESIVDNSAPSIEHLARVRRSILEVELALSHFVEQPALRGEHGRALDEALADAGRNMRNYLALPTYVEEQRAHIDLQEAWFHFEGAVTRTRELATVSTQEAALASFRQNVEPSRRRVLELGTRIIEANATRGREMARTIRETRRRAIMLGNALNIVCGLLAAVVGWLLWRQAIARRALIDAHVTAVEARAAELEQFAGRVAHDIRNPLAAARMAAELASRRRTEDEATRDLVLRVLRSLTRADAITTDLLAFARSGAQPDPGARTAPRVVIAEVIGDVSPDADRARIELRAEPVPAVGVACSTGVYLSLLGNLVRNAIKYMRDVATRRITVRVREEGNFIRTEVIDTGPGVPAEVLPSLFQPYFRGAAGGTEGLGLGLATVKRLAEGHGGRVGVSSQPGRGSTFWFTLPRAFDPGAEAESPIPDAQTYVHH